MKQKDMYTLEDLYGNLKISLSKLSKLSGINEGTLSRIRKGYSARVETVNRLLEAFSEIYGIEFSRENVSGITLEDKKAIRQQMLARQGVSEKEPVPSVSTRPYDDSSQTKEPQNRIVAHPDGLIPCKTFFEKQSHFEETFSESSWMRWIREGIKPRSGEREMFDFEERERSGNDGKYFFTPEQTQKAIEILRRHGKLK